MTQQTFNNGDTNLVVRNILNGNATDAESRLTTVETHIARRTEQGFFDYNDAGTSVTPISLLAGVETPITNDGLGAFTNKAFAPSGVSDVWNATTNQFDWSQLQLGDEILIRLDISFTALAVNTDLTIGVKLGIGGNAYTLNFVVDKEHKTATTYPNEIQLFAIYAGDTNTLDNPAEIVCTATKDAEIQINGFYVRIN